MTTLTSYLPLVQHDLDHLYRLGLKNGAQFFPVGTAQQYRGRRLTAAELGGWEKALYLFDRDYVASEENGAISLAYEQLELMANPGWFSRLLWLGDRLDRLFGRVELNHVRAFLWRDPYAVSSRRQLALARANLTRSTQADTVLLLEPGEARFLTILAGYTDYFYRSALRHAARTSRSTA